MGDLRRALSSLVDAAQGALHAHPSAELERAVLTARRALAGIDLASWDDERVPVTVTLMRSLDADPGCSTQEDAC